MSKVQDGKQYIVLNVESSTVIDLYGGSPDPGTKIDGWELNVKDYKEYTNNQVWSAHLQLSNANGDWFSFTNRGTGTAIDSGGVENANKQIFASIDNGSNNTDQQWLLYPISKGYDIKLYQLYNRTFYVAENSWYSPDLYGGSKTNGTSINNWPSSAAGTNPNQVWLFIEVDK